MVTSLAWAIVIAAVLAPNSEQASATAEPAPRAAFEQAASSFNYGEHQVALDNLNPYIAAWQKAAAHPLYRQRLIEAYELRARIRFGLGDRGGAREDFISVFRMDPAYSPTAQVSRQTVTLIEDVRASLVGTLQIRVTPSDATLTIAGEVFRANTERALMAGSHRVTAARPGYRSETLEAIVAPGQLRSFDMNLQRASAVLTVTGTPAGAEVIVDGQLRGQLKPRADSTAGELDVDGLAIGVHQLEIRSPCYVPRRSTVTVATIDDLGMNPVVLAEARGQLTITSQPRGAEIFVGGTARGPSPVSLKGLCEGNHEVDVRGSAGRLVTTAVVRANADTRVDARLIPMFALVNAMGEQAADRDDLAAVEKSLAAVESVAFWTPPSSPASATAIAILVEPVGPTLGLIAQERRARSTRELATAWNVQGLAVLAREDKRIRIDLYAAGSAASDRLYWQDDRDSYRHLQQVLDDSVALFQYSLPAKIADVAGFGGPVVIKPTTDGAFRVNDVLRLVSGQLVATVAALEALLATLPRDKPVVVEVADAGGQVRTVTTSIVRTPLLGSIEDDTLAFNVHLLKFASRAAATTDSVERSSARINQAIAHMRLKDWGAARQLLSDENAQPTSGLSAGVVAFLLGECADALNDPQTARRWWQTAVTAGGMLTADGPDVGALAKARLAKPVR